MAQYEDCEFCDWIVENAANNSLPIDWLDCKEKIVAYCTEKNIDNIKMYKNEKYGDFLHRCNDMKRLHNLDEKDVLRLIRKKMIPEKYKGLVLGSDLSMDKMIERVKIWEANDEESNKKNRNFNKNFDNYEIRTRKNEFRV
ncbi:hypothetical protein GVAV_002703 [Gurleya vavrai]